MIEYNPANKTKYSIKKLFNHLDIGLVIPIILLFIYSLFILYSASNQSVDMIMRHIYHFIFSFIVMTLISYIKPIYYQKYILLFYILSIILLILVLFIGVGGGGVHRWLNFGIITFQPSELAKIIVPITIAWYLTQKSVPPTAARSFIGLLIILAPVVIVYNQPDLGTAIIITISGIFVLFLAGIAWKVIILSAIISVATLPITWKYLLLDYQKQRIINLFYPSHDSLGSGWNIMQSKIAIGSGGLLGKGWLNNTQSKLEFLPESHTDFILAVLAEEFGLLGIIILIFLYAWIIIRATVIAIKADNSFNRLLAGSIIMVFFTYIFINISMTTGMMPIVGIPLLLISYGGSSMLTVMLSLGILMSINFNRQFLPQ